MIPKIIHYCWFGGNPLPEELKLYIDTWRFYCPDYEIRVWDESNFDINSHPFTKSAYALKKYAYVSDYVRAYVLNKFGGIYLDTDVEIKKNFDVFLKNDSFSGFEQKGIPFSTAIWGSKKNHFLTKKALEYYEGRMYTLKEKPNPVLLSNLVEQYFEIDIYNDKKQVGYYGDESLTIYPTETFCLDLEETYATHHFSGSWIGDTTTTFKDYVHAHYHLSKTLKYSNASSVSILKGIAYSLTFKQSCQIIIFNLFYKLRNIWKKNSK